MPRSSSPLANTTACRNNKSDRSVEYLMAILYESSSSGGRLSSDYHYGSGDEDGDLNEVETDCEVKRLRRWSCATDTGTR